MAFTFIVEDGTGIADANSYASVEAADKFFEIDIHEQTWPTLSDEVKEKLLAHSTRLLERRIEWKFKPSSTTQALHWPVQEGVYSNKVPIEVDEIPEEVIEATIVYARILADGPPADNAAREGLKRVEVDVVEIEFDPQSRVKRIPDEVARILDGLGRERGAGPKHGKIRRA